MSLISRAGDLVYTFRFLKMLTTPFDETDAFKLGIIDKDGKRIKSKKVETSGEKSAYSSFHRLVFNIKKLLAKAMGIIQVSIVCRSSFLVKRKLQYL